MSRWLLAGAVGVGAVLRFATLDVQSFGHDEAVTAARILQPTLGQTLDAVTESERTPHLYYVVAWAWTRPFGVGEIGLRSLSALLGTATIPLAYLAARSLVSRRAAAIAAWLVAVSPFLVFYSQEARSYALLVLLGTVALWCFARALKEPTTRNLAGWAVMSCLALSTHYLAAFPFVAEAGVLLLASAARARVAVWTVLPLAVGLALLPLAFDQGDLHSAMAGSMPTYRDLPTLTVQFLAGERLGVPGAYTATPILGAALLATFAGLMAIAWQRRATGALACGAIALAAVGGPLVLAAVGTGELVGAGLFSARNAIGAVVPLSVLAAYGIALISSGPARTTVAVTACAAMTASVAAATIDSGLQRPDWRSVAETIDGTGPQALVVARGGDDPLLYYLRADHVRRMPAAGARVHAVRLVRPDSVAAPRIEAGSLREGRARRLGDFEIVDYAPVRPDRLLKAEDLTDHSNYDLLLLGS